MRNLLIVCVVLVLGITLVSSASAADLSKQVSASQLQAMGLADMQPVSDARGEAIRGKGVLLIQAAYASNYFKTAAAGTLYYSSCCPNRLTASSSANVFGASSYSTISVR